MGSIATLAVGFLLGLVASEVNRWRSRRAQKQDDYRQLIGNLYSTYLAALREHYGTIRDVLEAIEVLEGLPDHQTRDLIVGYGKRMELAHKEAQRALEAVLLSEAEPKFRELCSRLLLEEEIPHRPDDNIAIDKIHKQLDSSERARLALRFAIRNRYENVDKALPAWMSEREAAEPKNPELDLVPILDTYEEVILGKEHQDGKAKILLRRI